MQNSYQMIPRMCTRSPASLICAMVMAFTINVKAGEYLSRGSHSAGRPSVFIMNSASRYYQQAFPKYDDMNASVQENVSAIRVVKAYVREEEETVKFKKGEQAHL